MQSGDMEPAQSSTAPVYTVPQERVVSIEHPCVVRNFDNGIKSLGGEPRMKHVSAGVSTSVVTIELTDPNARCLSIA